MEIFSSYNALPTQLSVINASGTSMKLSPRGSEILTGYWSEFGSASEYKVLLPADTPGVCVVTKNGDRPVGCIIRSQTAAGALVLLPDIDFEPDNFFGEEIEEDDEIPWSAEAKQFASRFVSAIVALDKALRSSAEITPEPAWATDSIYTLAMERTLRADLLEAEREVEQAQRRKEAIVEKLENAGHLRALLYEKGKVLESAIIEALRLMGFRATHYKQADSEFDVIFESDEGRLLGEAEGKDARAISVDKLRQLAMNIHEDLQRDEVVCPAKGVLFGNGYRLTAPSDREVQFTDKCLTAARSSATALVATSDLYTAVQYLADQKDDDYSKLCREALLAGVGIVTLPQPPTDASTQLSEVNKDDDAG